MKTFKALESVKTEEGNKTSIIEKSISDLPEGDLLIKVNYSSLNYKDALSASGSPGVTRNYPHTPGIDAVGIIEESNNSSFKEGDSVIVTGYDLGMNTAGGFGQYIRVPSSWAILLPAGLEEKDSMCLGTAGLTAGLSISAIAEKLKLMNLSVIVTGATGGVGSIAVRVLSSLGAKVTGVTGKKEETNLKEDTQNFSSKISKASDLVKELKVKSNNADEKLSSITSPTPPNALKLAFIIGE